MSDYEKLEEVFYESTKQKFYKVLELPHLCGLCLKNDQQLLQLEIALNKPMSFMCENIISYIFRNKIVHPTSKYICDQCSTRIRDAFNFIQETKELSRKIKYCFEKLEFGLKQVNQQQNMSCKSNLLIIISKPSTTKQKADTFKHKTKINMEPNTMTVEILENKPEYFNCGLENYTNDCWEIIKHKFANVLLNSQLCGLCLEKTKELYDIESKISVSGNQQTLTVILKEIINYLFDEAFHPASRYVCDQCSKKVIELFTFMHNTKELYEEIENYIEKLESGLDQIMQRLNTSSGSNLLIIIPNDKTTDQVVVVKLAKTSTKINCPICDKNIQEKDISKHLKKTHPYKIYICNSCGLIHFSFKDFKAHFEICVNENKNKLQCFLCSKKFKNDQELESHKCRHACPHCSELPCVHYRYIAFYRDQAEKGNVKRMVCLDCDYTSSQRDQLIGHINKEHLNYYPFTCTDCGQQFYTKEVFTYHMRKFHSDITICKYCDKTFLLQTQYEKHLERCGNIRRKYQCTKCVANFDDGIRLKNHQKLRHTDEIYPCDLCNSKFTSALKLEMHKSRVHNGLQGTVEYKITQCGTCLKKFKYIQDYRKHIKKHGSNLKHICGVCQKEFESAKKLQWHRVQHSKERTERVECSECGKELTIASMKVHMLYHFPHPFVCEACGKSFPTKGSLNLHKYVHEEASPCPKCQMLVKPRLLKRHYKQYCEPRIRRKLKEKFKAQKSNLKYNCEFCDYTTKTKYLMENHIQIHVNPKYTSEVLNKRFKTKQTLVNQKNMDRDVYTCDLCDTEFTQKSSLVTHLAEHEQFECDLCEEKFVSVNTLQEHKIEKHMMS